MKGELEGEGSRHDWWHIFRVWKLAKRIGEEEKADMFVVELGALLHDIGDPKLNDGNVKKGKQKVSDWLKKWARTK